MQNNLGHKIVMFPHNVKFLYMFINLGGAGMVVEEAGAGAPSRKERILTEEERVVGDLPMQTHF